MCPPCNSLQGEKLPQVNREDQEGQREPTVRRGQHWGPGGELGVDKTLGTQSHLPLLFRRSPSEWDQLTRTESEPIRRAKSTGPFPT